MSQSHTPGPWRQDTMSGTTVWGGDKTHGNAVAVCQGFEREENRANAALIAAAPDLLDAARCAIAYDAAIQSCANDPDRMSSFCTAEGDSLDALYAAWIDAARAAIAKATGG